MKRKKFLTVTLCFAWILLFTGCGDKKDSEESISSNTDPAYLEDISDDTREDMEIKNEETSDEEVPAPILLYMGHASIRIVTEDGKVIYIDPYAGDSYDMAADLILVTHSHYDHNDIDKIKLQNEDCEIITWQEAIQNGKYQVFKFEYVTVEAVEAGYNEHHNEKECVGYILTFNNGKSVYVTGDTSMTEQMPLLAQKEIDYAFYCCDGVYNMDFAEAARCAEIVGAKHDIPYHMAAADGGILFDRDIAEKFASQNLMIVENGEEIKIE